MFAARVADHDRDLLEVRERDLGGVAGVRACRARRTRSSSRGCSSRRRRSCVELHAPLDEQLAERVVDVGRRLGVQDAGLRVRVQRRDARLLARRVDAAVRGAALDRARVHGRVVDVDADAGGTICRSPSTNTSRCACTWCCSVSYGCGTSPAARVRAIALVGAGHGAAPTVGAGRVVVVGASADLPDDEHPASNTATTPTTQHRRNMR